MALWKTEDTADGVPTFVSEADKEHVVGIDVNEAQVNRAKGIKTPGWVHYRTYADNLGNTRHRVDTLVAARSMDVEKDEDALPNFYIKLKNLPKAVVVPEDDTAEIVISATVLPEDGAPSATYQWEGKNDGVWEELDGETTNALVLAWGAEYAGKELEVRCAVSAAGLETRVSTVTAARFAEETEE